MTKEVWEKIYIGKEAIKNKVLSRFNGIRVETLDSIEDRQLQATTHNTQVESTLHFETRRRPYSRSVRQTFMAIVPIEVNMVIEYFY